VSAAALFGVLHLKENGSMASPSKATSLDTLTRLLGEAFSLHGRGASGARLGRAYGVADGYMLALMELGVATQRELGSVVAGARARLLSAPSDGELAPVETGVDATGARPSSASNEGTRAA
jgi:hypothetical protein